MNRYVYSLNYKHQVFIIDRKLKREHLRPEYTPLDAADLCRWLNVREAGYPANAPA